MQPDGQVEIEAASEGDGRSMRGSRGQARRMSQDPRKVMDPIRVQGILHLSFFLLFFFTFTSLL